MRSDLSQKTFLAIFLASIAAPALWAQVKIVDPVNGAYLSGQYEVVLEATANNGVTDTEFYLDGKLAFEAPGFVAQFLVDFGPDVVNHEMYARLLLADGSTIDSPRVTTREIRVDVTQTTKIVLLGAVVKTRSNNYVLGLTRDKFSILENGQPLEIESFFNERLPLDLVFMLDKSSSLRVKGIDDVKTAATTFLKELEAGDRVSLYSFSKEPYPLSDFTTDRKRLIEKILALEPLGETALYDSLLRGLADLEGARRGRKALVLFTDGRDSIYEEPADKAFLLRKAIRTAQNQEVAIFTVGLGTRIHKQALERIALETGGRFLFAENATQLPALFAEIIADLKHQYIIGVNPSGKSGYRDLDIRVKKRGVVVYARKGYTR